MAFQFSLEAVLRLRRSQQRQQEILLANANEKVNSLLRELENIAEEFARISPSGMGSEIRGAELHFNESRRRVLQSRRQQIEQQLTKEREHQSAMAAELRKQWQAREVVETLREREFQTYSLEQSRYGQRVQDDLFLSRKNSSRQRQPLFLPS
ncbi:MAG TPA: flagellar FliJ family protein [Terriglobales bacterium]|jgi:flagellar export protein FliJ|nr:flagellar FliJ family protein [Terriglobales bacterium]